MRNMKNFNHLIRGTVVKFPTREHKTADFHKHPVCEMNIHTASTCLYQNHCHYFVQK